ncbi:ABC transporter permease [Acetobacter sp.]|jgi:putative spermidine/putrescine transport system permease protein|uniref:ABC transporter permease n=1 Tax=Acetobacter sp. TaxID=440 RepID=UPI0025BABB03|nr:ABC transporter permease [Acetobacter sp.]MCH4091738.1 ABC transporter permease [Acetobacter sp.]MCI1300405.1 ABC transporter permease [Acetobacter sp.]MCI1316776.1 ABC transporter permease [Acetobacter sp.]
MTGGRKLLGHAALLLPPFGWLTVFYLGSLFALLLSAFWQVDSMSGEILHEWTLDNFRILVTDSTYRVIAERTIGIAVLVTITDIILAWPLAYVIARKVGPRMKLVLLVLVALPLWSSMLARIYSWRLILGHDGVLNWFLRTAGLPEQSFAFTNVALWIVFTYLWLPFMLMPLVSALERIPASLPDAAGDMGATPFQTFRTVIFPLAIPGMAAGSVFTFAVTLGEYVTPMLVGGAGSEFIGNVVYSNVGVSGNIPFAAAYSMILLVVVAAYMLLARQFGAFDGA